MSRVMPLGVHVVVQSLPPRPWPKSTLTVLQEPLVLVQVQETPQKGADSWQQAEEWSP